MATPLNALSDRHVGFIGVQPIFFVATAARAGAVNCSPKRLDSLRIIDADHIIWLNLTGSGNETAAHVRENGRMTLMFCAFEGPPLIHRVYGMVRVLHPRDPDFDDLAARFPAMAGSRRGFDPAIERVQTSCGNGVPLMGYEKQRGAEELLPFCEKLGPEGVDAYWARKNHVSLDGQPTGTGE